MSASWHEARERLLAVAKRMSAEGLVVGTSGNASLRLPIADGILITPRGLPYETMTAADMVALDLRGESTEGELAPSSESHMHLAVYEARPDVRGVVHTHSVYASAAAVTGVSIPPILDEMVIVLGGVVRVSDYGFPGTEELSRNALEALGDRNAVLLRNHGVLGVGATAEAALEACCLVERIARILVHAKALGEPTPLAPEIVEIERSLFLMQREALAMDGGTSDARATQRLGGDSDGNGPGVHSASPLREGQPQEHI